MRLTTAICITLLAATAPVNAQSPIDTVRAVRVGYPATVNDEQIGAMTKEVARRLGAPYGILQKHSGRNCDGYSCDVLCAGNGEQQQQFDIWEASGAGLAKPAWGVIPREKMRLDTCDVIGASQPPSNPPPTASCDLSDVNARLDLLLEAVGKIQAAEDAQNAKLALQGEKLDTAIGQATTIIAELQKGVKSKPDRLTQILSVAASILGAVGAAK